MVERSDTTGEPSEALVPGAYCPSHPSSRTIYGLIAYLCQIAERISSDPIAALPEFPGAGRHPCVRLNICQAMLENGRENFIRSTCVHTSLKS